MIFLTRVRTAPPVDANFHGAKRTAANLKLLKMKRDGQLEGASEKKWNSGFWKKAKDQLLVETHNKCAYCETPTAVVSFGDVEHFRPKSVYWWLAYCYDNYLASCAMCNQKYKSDNFVLRTGATAWRLADISTLTDAQLSAMAATLTTDPIVASAGMKYTAFAKSIKDEEALLVHPYFDDPAIYYAYKPIVESGEVHVVPTKKKYEDVVKAANDFFGINRIDLLKLRYQQYCRYMTLRHTLADTAISANTRAMNQAQLNQLKSGVEAYTGMIRYFETQDLEDLPWNFVIPG